MCVGTYCSDVAYLPTFVWGYNLASLISEGQIIYLIKMVLSDSQSTVYYCSCCHGDWITSHHCKQRQ